MAKSQENGTTTRLGLKDYLVNISNWIQEDVVKYSSPSVLK